MLGSARPDEEEATAALVPNAQLFGVAFGVALCAIIAGASGLTRDASPPVVAAAAQALFGTFAFTAGAATRHRRRPGRAGSRRARSPPRGCRLFRVQYSTMVESMAGLDLATLGERIRRERDRRRLSLNELAARAGVSRSMLSAVERGAKAPTVLVLDRIATGLDTSIARLLGQERAGRVVVLRHDEQDVARDRAGWERRVLSPVLPGVEFELMRTTIDAGVDAGAFSPHAPGSREYLAVERGTLRLTLDGSRSHAARRRQHLLRRRLSARVRQPWRATVRVLPRHGRGGRSGARAPPPARRDTTMSDAPAIDRDAFRQLALAAADLAHDHLRGVPDGPVFTPMTPEERGRLLEQPLPDDGQDPRAILDLFREAVLPHVMGNGHPRFFGWVNSPPAPVGVLADLLAAAMNPSCAGGDHAAIYVERAAVRWLMELVRFPTTGSMGLLVSGASVATIVALAAARRRITAAHGWDVRAEGMQGNHPRLRVYVTAEGHSCLHKAAELLGFGASAIRTIPHDDEFRMDVTALRDAIASDRRAGDLPFCVAASAGTVGTGAIDPLNEIADVCAQERIWFHVDGAYGALGILSIGQEARYTGMARADSLALDPHKWLSVPVECGCLLVRDGALLRDTFSLVPPYLRTEEGKGFGGLPWFSEYGVQQTRGFRALKLWMVLQHLGRNGVTALIDHHLALAQDLAALIDATPDLERLAPVTLSIVAFRYAPPALRGDDPSLDALNKKLMERLQSEGAAFLTNTTVHGRFALRACILHYGTTESDIAALIDVVRRTGSALVTADLRATSP